MALSFAGPVELWSLDRLIPHARNARTHSDAQVAQIAGSIAEFGFVNPVLVGDDGVIVAGHGRIMAARKLGLEQAPVIVLAHLSPTQRRALMIADNQIASNSGWDDEMLAIELAALKDEDFDLDLLGFDDTALDRLLANTIEATEASDQVPEPPSNPISRPGDVWICGEHRVVCGDATVLGDVEKVLDGQLADMTFCDPPYNVNYANSASDKQRGKNRAILNDALSERGQTCLRFPCTRAPCLRATHAFWSSTCRRAFSTIAIRLGKWAWTLLCCATPFPEQCVLSIWRGRPVCR